MTKCINDYMDKWAGRKVSEAQEMSVYEWDKLTAKLARMREQKGVLISAGLDVEAKRVQQSINALERERRDLEDQLNEERRALVKCILLCFAAADIATEAADRFAEQLHKTSRGLYGGDNSFSQKVRDQATAFNKLVQILDEGDNEVISMHYAEMAERINAATMPVIMGIINETMNSPKGKRYY